MLFPRLACHFESNQAMRIIAGVDPNLNTDVNFAPDKVHGEFSPFLKFMVGDTHAFTISLRAIFDATVTFEMRGKESFAKGNLDNIDLADFTFVAGTVEEIDLFDIIKLFKPTVIPIVKDVANKILNPGFTIPVFVAIKDIFEVDVDDILMQMKDKYMEISFTLDIHKREKLIEKLLKLFSE